MHGGMACWLFHGFTWLPCFLQLFIPVTLIAGDKEIMNMLLGCKYQRAQLQLLGLHQPPADPRSRPVVHELSQSVKQHACESP